MDNAERLFNEIVKEYSERVYWHVRRFVNNHEDADDLVQEIFLKIWTALPSFRGEAQLFTWVYRIATNETLNWLRREKVRSALRFEKQRQVFILRYYDEMPYEQMSEVLDTSVGALKASFHIAQEKVRASLGKDFFVGSD